MKTRLGLLLLALVILAGTSSAGTIYVSPPGLDPGQQYRLLFVTSTGTLAASTSIAFYDTFVTGVAATVPQLSTISWSAVGSTSGVDARDNTNTNPGVWTGVPVYLLDGTLLASNNADLWDGALPAAAGIDENGDPLGTTVFTGTTASGVKDTYVLGYGPGFGDPVRTGLSNVVDGQWVFYGVQGAGQPGRMYAMSETLTAIPEPGTVALFLLGAGFLAVTARRRRSR